MLNKHILVVDDEPAIREMVRFALERSGFAVEEAGDSIQARETIATSIPDLLLLDWMLPGLSGIDLARRLKKEELTAEMPIIMLTARGEDDDKVRGLEAGADDYIAKPFSPRELIARIRAVLRRTSPRFEEAVIACGALQLDSDSHRISANGRPITVGPTEFRLLHFFMTHRERVYSRGQLLDQVWGSNTCVEERTVDVHIRRLRKALVEHSCDSFIQTVRGVGYRFSEQI